MSAYYVGSFEITNPEAFAAYPPAMLPTLEPHGGEVVVADLESEVIEGEPLPITIVLRFPDEESARAWYGSEAYQGVIHLRRENARGTLVRVGEFGAAPPA